MYRYNKISIFCLIDSWGGGEAARERTQNEKAAEAPGRTHKTQNQTIQYSIKYTSTTDGREAPGEYKITMNKFSTNRTRQKNHIKKNTKQKFAKT